ncbi:uncharacterized protein DDB_G0284459 [Scaptodrosophila lebanonensis]|uniref:Uncharacterized protein DDB_G0284459 n=1 Tax=Drosophila lebanonensis TaxID=7225 RepID=A0A6J2T9M2_DROLE|nr:uncharacterized protein DDB_G0284459 [Scaptodrosophila lebanonensis]
MPPKVVTRRQRKAAEAKRKQLEVESSNTEKGQEKLELGPSTASTVESTTKRTQKEEKPQNNDELPPDDVNKEFKPTSSLTEMLTALLAENKRKIAMERPFKSMTSLGAKSSVNTTSEDVNMKSTNESSETPTALNPELLPAGAVTSDKNNKGFSSRSILPRPPSPKTSAILSQIEKKLSEESKTRNTIKRSLIEKEVQELFQAKKRNRANEKEKKNHAGTHNKTEADDGVGTAEKLVNKEQAYKNKFNEIKENPSLVQEVFANRAQKNNENHVEKIENPLIFHKQFVHKIQKNSGNPNGENKIPPQVQGAVVQNAHQKEIKPTGTDNKTKPIETKKNMALFRKDKCNTKENTQIEQKDLIVRKLLHTTAALGPDKIAKKIVYQKSSHSSRRITGRLRTVSSGRYVTLKPQPKLKVEEQDPRPDMKVGEKKTQCTRELTKVLLEKKEKRLEEEALRKLMQRNQQTLERPVKSIISASNDKNVTEIELVRNDRDSKAVSNKISYPKPADSGRNTTEELTQYMEQKTKQKKSKKKKGSNGCNIVAIIDHNQSNSLKTTVKSHQPKKKACEKIASKIPVLCNSLKKAITPPPPPPPPPNHIRTIRKSTIGIGFSTFFSSASSTEALKDQNPKKTDNNKQLPTTPKKIEAATKKAGPKISAKEIKPPSATTQIQTNQIANAKKIKPIPVDNNGTEAKVAFIKTEASKLEEVKGADATTPKTKPIFAREPKTTPPKVKFTPYSSFNDAPADRDVSNDGDNKQTDVTDAYYPSPPQPIKVFSKSGYFIITGTDAQIESQLIDLTENNNSSWRCVMMPPDVCDKVDQQLKDLEKNREQILQKMRDKHKMIAAKHERRVKKTRKYSKY